MSISNRIGVTPSLDLASANHPESTASLINQQIPSRHTPLAAEDRDRAIHRRGTNDRHRFHPYRNISRLSVPQRRAAQINARLQQRFGLRFMGELPNLTEVDHNRITDALNTLGGGYPEKSRTLATIHHLCQAKDLDIQTKGFEAALTLIQYGILSPEQNYGMLGETLCHLAARHCEDPDIITRLNSIHKIDINEKNVDGDTSLHLVAQHNSNLNVLTILIELGADVGATNNDGMKPIQVAAMGSRQPKIFTTLQRWGADLNTVDDASNTLLHLAIMYENLPATIALMEEGADPRKKNADDDTPMSLAMDEAFIDPQIVHALLHPNQANR